MPARGPRSSRTINVEPFAVPALADWERRRPSMSIDGELLFSLRKSGTPVTDMSFGNIVHAALDAIGFQAMDMGPRVLRNTFCRRLLLAGLDRQAVSDRMGLASTRTADRLVATLAA